MGHVGSFFVNAFHTNVRYFAVIFFFNEPVAFLLLVLKAPYRFAITGLATDGCIVYPFAMGRVPRRRGFYRHGEN